MIEIFGDDMLRVLLDCELTAPDGIGLSTKQDATVDAHRRFFSVSENEFGMRVTKLSSAGVELLKYVRAEMQKKINERS